MRFLSLTPLALALHLVVGCGDGTAPADCPSVAGTYTVTGALQSDRTCTGSGTSVIEQTACDIDVYVSGGPDGGMPVFSCTLSPDGSCTVIVGGTVTLEPMLGPEGGTVRMTEMLSGTVCDAVWSR